MKTFKYLIAIVLLLPLVRCTGDGEVKVKSLNRVDISDFQAYAGISPSGYTLIEYENDSTRDATARRLLGNDLEIAPVLYEYNSFEFFENKVIYTYYISGKEYTTKFVSDYEFRGDTLYVSKSDGTWINAGIGTKDSLYQTRAVLCFPQNGTRAVQSFDRVQFNLDSVLNKSNYASLDEMVPGDTIAWCNVKYIYK